MLSVQCNMFTIKCNFQEKKFLAIWTLTRLNSALNEMGDLIYGADDYGAIFNKSDPVSVQESAPSYH